MRRQRMVPTAALLCFTAIGSALLWRRAPEAAIVLWAWERPEDLRFTSAGEVSVAFLARTLVLHGDSVLVRPRMQPLAVPSGATLIAVARIESNPAAPPLLSRAQREKAVELIAGMGNASGISEIQVDYDATASERAFYRSLLDRLRNELPPSMRLSITALASWCLEDNWIAGLPVAEAVPMLFRMGPDGPLIRRRLRQGDDFSEPLCRQSLGISTDEPIPSLPPGRRVYIFHPRPWSALAFQRASREVRSWQ